MWIKQTLACRLRRVHVGSLGTSELAKELRGKTVGNKFAAVVGIFCLFLFVSIVSCTESGKPAETEQNKAAETSISAQGRRQATLAEQKMCADQAKRFFTDEIRTQIQIRATVMVPPDYIDHYDAKANACYVAILRFDSIDGGKTMTTSVGVFDAFENTSYATYVWTSDKVKKYWQVKPTMCTVSPPGLSTVTCTSDGEFDELVEKYFGLHIQ